MCLKNAKNPMGSSNAVINALTLRSTKIIAEIAGSIVLPGRFAEKESV
jgi:hypothetical protein